MTGGMTDAVSNDEDEDDADLSDLSSFVDEAVVAAAPFADAFDCGEGDSERAEFTGEAILDALIAFCVSSTKLLYVHSNSFVWIQRRCTNTREQAKAMRQRATFKQCIQKLLNEAYNASKLYNRTSTLHL